MIQYAYYRNRLGLWKIGYESESVVWMKTVNTPDTPSIPSKTSDKAAAQLQEYLDGHRTSFDLPLCPFGSDFQNRVWSQLMEIPWGKIRTYGEIATAINMPGAARAVGQAANKNPIWIMIPCHRLVGKGNKLTGYAGDTDMKQILLNLEQKKSPET